MHNRISNLPSPFSHVNARREAEDAATEQNRQGRALNVCSAPCPAQDWAAPCFLQKGHDGQHGNGWRRW